MASNETLNTFEKVNVILIVFLLALEVIYLLLLLLWVVPAIGLLVNSCKRLRNLSALSRRDIDEYTVHMKYLYKERAIRYTLFVCYLITAVIVYLLLPLFPIRDLAILFHVNSNYFNDSLLVVASHFISSFFFSIFCVLFALTIWHLRKSIKIVNYSIKKLLCKSVLWTLMVLVLPIIDSITYQFTIIYHFTLIIWLNFMCVIIIPQLFILYIIREIKLFLRELEWEREDALSYHTKHSNVIKEKNWLIKHYRRVLWWTVLAFQTYRCYIILHIAAYIVTHQLTDIYVILYKSILLAVSSICEIIAILLMITLNVYVLSVVYIKNRRGRKWRYNYHNCGLREPLLH